MGRKSRAKANKKNAAAPQSQDVNEPSATVTRRNVPHVGAPSTSGLAFLQNKVITDTNTKPIFRNKPNMALDGAAIMSKLLALSSKERSTTEERMYQAYLMIQEIQSLQSHRSNDNWVDIDTLKNDPSYVKECVLRVKSFVSSGFRIPCAADIMIGSPLPSCACHITSLYPLESNDVQLLQMDALSFVILLNSAICFSVPGKERLSLQIIHELHAHAEGGYDWLDFDKLNEHDETKELDESYLRFALATIGIKNARALYRHTDLRVTSPFQSANDGAIESKPLLRSIKIFGEEQCNYMPKSPVGYYNLGWVSTQVKHNGEHEWVAANQCYKHMAEALFLADESDDDFYRATAGVELALSLIVGGKPIVGCSMPSGKVQVVRDFSGEVTDRSYMTAENEAAAGEASEHEQERQINGVAPTKLGQGEAVLVAHWEVSHVWNFAMEAYTKVDNFGFGSYVYGETQGWNEVEAFLSGKYGVLQPMIYRTCPFDVGFKRTREKGRSQCDHCGKYESDDTGLKRCSRCRKALYCGAQCQRKAWSASHKNDCRPVEAI